MEGGARIPRVRALDGIRGIAVAAVVLFHAEHLRGGYLGVEVFFVLSGFLITSLLLAEGRSEGRVGLGAFWARRARRLLPALVVLLLGVGLYAVVLAKPEELAQIRGDAFATMGYVANWRSILTGNDYWALFRSPSPLEHTWSLAIEEQFYLVWPLVFVGLLAWRRERVAPAVLVTGVAMALLSSAWMWRLVGSDDPSRAYFGTDTRLIGIGAGAALAGLLAWRGPLRGRGGRVALEVAGIAAALVVGATFAVLPGTSYHLYRGGFLLFDVAVLAVIAAAAHPTTGPLGRLLGWRPLVGLGLISYGVYLWHWPVDIVLSAERAHLTGWSLFALQCAVTLAIALASYHLVEMPIRRGALRSASWRWVIPATAALLVAVVTGATIGARAPEAVAGASDGPPGGLLVVGDSVAGSIIPGFTAAGVRPATSWLAGCRLLPGRAPGQQGATLPCPWEGTWRAAVRRNRPAATLVVIGPFDLLGRELPGGGVSRPGDPAWDAAYRRRLERLVTVVGSRGGRVVIPTIPCFGPMQSGLKDSGLTTTHVLAADRVIAAVGRAHPDVVSTPNLFGFLCPGLRYRAGQDGVAKVRSDGVHFTPEGAELVARWLEPQLGLGPTTGTTTTTG